MARPRKDEAPDLRKSVDLTAGTIERFKCADGKSQVFMRDSKAPGLRVRATAAGAKSFVFERKLAGQTIRKTIGDVQAWTIEQARVEARRLTVQVDQGVDPRAWAREQQAARDATAAMEAAQGVKFAEAWADYIADRKPHWGERHYADHVAMTSPGGENTKRGTRGRGVTIAGPLHHFMTMPLRDLSTDHVAEWAAVEGKARPTRARLALRHLRAFLNWCAEHSDYKLTVPDAGAAKSKAARQQLGKARAKGDTLLKVQLPTWFAAVQALDNVPAAAYLQCMVLTGARPGELRALKWADINWRWKGLALRDKVEGDREIPLTPYVARLLDALPRRGAYVFPSVRGDKPMSRAHTPLARACAVAGVEGLTLHGLRRSFKNLTEWTETPVGVVAQIMGHKPSATAEKHYTARPLDLLRMHHERIEAWILEQAGIPFEATEKPRRLEAVA